MPLHLGHLALIDHAAALADRVTVLLCVEADEPIGGEEREAWLRTTFDGRPAVAVRRFDYHDAELPASSESSHAASRLWTDRLRPSFPGVDLIVGSEAYVRYVAEYWGIGFALFDVDRSVVPISATEIRAQPYRYRHYLAPAARPAYVRRVVLHGTESTGKSTLVERMARAYGTVFVPETARDIVGHTDTVTYEDLERIAERQAVAILAALPRADGVLFIDTDVYSTLAYSRYLFGRDLPLRPKWLRAAENDLCLYFSPEVALIQDGTRLGPAQRLELDAFHRQARRESGVATVEVNGTNHEHRTARARRAVRQLLER